MACRGAAVALFLVGALLVPHIAAQSSCYEACSDDYECAGQLVCLIGVCNDDPEVGTSICTEDPPPSAPPPEEATDPSSCYEACSTDYECAGQLVCLIGVCNDDPEVGTSICTEDTPPSAPPPEGATDPPPSAPPPEGATDPPPSAPPPEGATDPPPSPPPPEGATCLPSDVGFTSPPITECTIDNNSECCNSTKNDDCCVTGMTYPTYGCSPPESANTNAILTLNGFGEGEEGGGRASCTGIYYRLRSDKVVALSTGWFKSKERCNKTIKITLTNGGLSKIAFALVVDECDSRVGCDFDHGYLHPCRNNIVDASPGVWDDLGLNTEDPNNPPITWSLID